MSPDTYHRYATFFDAARALPNSNYQHIRLNGDEAAEAYRAWAAHNRLEVVETPMERYENGRRIEWSTLDSPDVNVGAYLDDRACVDTDAPTPDPKPAPQPELDIPF